MLKALDPFYYLCLLVLRAIGFLLLPFGLKSFWLFLLAFSFSCSLFFLHILLFLALRINLMIFQILNNSSLFPHSFKSQQFLTFSKQQIQKTYALFKHSFGKQKLLSPHQTNSTSFKDKFRNPVLLVLLWLKHFSFKRDDGFIGHS